MVVVVMDLLREHEGDVNKEEARAMTQCGDSLRLRGKK